MKATQRIRRFFGKDSLAFCLSLVSCFSMVFTPPVFADEPAPFSVGPKCNEAIKNMEQMCVTKPKATALPLGALDGGAGIENSGASLQSAAAAASNVSTETAMECQNAADECKTKCYAEADAAPYIAPSALAAQSPKIKADGDRCLQIGGDLAKGYAQQGAQMAQDSGAAGETKEAATGGKGEGGDMSGLIGPLLAVGAIAGGLCLMGTLICEKEKKEEAGASTVDSGYTAVDCEKKDDAYQNANCADIFLTKCKANPQAKDCDKFANGYCGLGDGSDSGGGITPTTTGDGVGSTYCQLVVSQRYCGTSGRDSCPSCLNLARMSSPTCTTNPAICLPQMTQADKETSQLTCPTDPLFSNPMFMAQDSGTPEGNPDAGTDGTTSPGSNSSGDGTSVASVNGKTSNEGAGVYRGSSRGRSGYSSANSNGTFAGGNSGDVAGFGSNSRNIASAQVAPGIAPALGSSLFARHSQVVSQRCRASKLNNCGPRGSSVAP